MHLRFGPDDDAQFQKARADLLDRFEAWLAHQRPQPDLDAREAGLALDWKWGYGDGDLVR